VLTGEGQNERHSYEKCQYEEFKKRVAKMDEIKAARAEEKKRILEQ
jgi:NADH dehydrogenase (ubiquinone) 1 beta subcomplex subunit 7